jgi:hypothetical protein
VVCTSALGCAPSTSERPAHEVQPATDTRLDGSLLGTQRALDAGTARAGQKGLDASTDARAVDAAAAVDAASASADAQSSKTDAAPAMDFCGQTLPVDPSASGLLEGSVDILQAIPQHPSVNPRGPAVSAQFGTRVVWIFGEAVARGSLSDVVAVNSYTLSNFDRPYELDEALPDAGPPLSLVPELASDLALGADERLHYEMGNLVPVGPTELLLFYSPIKRRQPENQLTDEVLGTRVAHVKTDLKSIWAESEPELLFPASAPSMRSALQGRDGNVYLYGCPQQPSSQFDCLLARAPIGSATLARSYQYRTTGGWSNDLNVAVPVLSDAGPELSVSYNPYLRRYLAVFFSGLSNQIALQTAERPEGPFTPLGTVTLPKPSADSASSFRNLVEHPELSRKCGKQLVLTFLNPTGSGNYELTPIELELR